MSARNPPTDWRTIPPTFSMRLPTDSSLALLSPSKQPFTSALAIGIRNPSPRPVNARHTSMR